MVLLSNSEYKTRYTLPFHEKIQTNDIDAYNAYPKFNFVYNKFFVIKSQGVECNEMSIMPTSYPVFIKPKMNLRGGNRGCLIANNKNEFLSIKSNCDAISEANKSNTDSFFSDSFWSSVIEGQEASTDFVVQNGQIMWELDYKIQKLPDSIIGVETLISTKNRCPNKVRNWIHKYLNDYTGIVNLQYIGDTIIEAGLRPDAGGRFIQWTENKELIKNINYFTETGKWIHQPKEVFDFEDVYVIGCYKDYPIIYYIPSPIMELIFRNNQIQNWHYYVDVQKKGKKYLNIVDRNREKLIQVKEKIEFGMMILNWLFIIAFISILSYVIGSFALKQKLSKRFYYIVVIIIALYLTRFMNPPRYIYNHEI